MKITVIFLGLLFFFLMTFYLSGDTNQGFVTLTLPSIFSDRMVLQQQRNVSIWGWDKPGTAIAVTFRGQKILTQAELDGKWIASVNTGAAGGPFTLLISGTKQQKLEDVLVGEVWVAGGQSNMWWPVSRSLPIDPVSDSDLGDSETRLPCPSCDPEIRVWDANTAPNSEGWRARQPQKTVQAEWKITTPETVGNFPATAYFFARELHQTLKVPIGIVHLAVPGQKIETFFSNEFIQVNLPHLVNNSGDKNQPNYEGKAAELFNGMVYPAAPYSARGFIWWQGESNAGEFLTYRVLFPALIQEWRRWWHNENAPFLFVELANFLEKQTYPVEEDPWPSLRDAQKEGLKLPNTAMISTIDILPDTANPNEIHPPNKQLAGHRLYLAAIANVYGQKDISWSGPQYQSVQFEDGKAIVTFNYVGAGLMVANGGELKGFALAGSDRRFFWADAKIQNNQVILTSKAVPNPVVVRYGWANNPIGNLYNQAGLPAFPFRSDRWTLGLNKAEWKNMEMVELAAYIQRELMPQNPQQKLIWQQIYQAIASSQKSKAKQLIVTLRQQPIAEANLDRALPILDSKIKS